MARVPGEEPGLSELDHALQCAAKLKQIAPDDRELQIAGLVHDVAHGHCHIRDHDRVGAAAVRSILGDRVADLVALHVDAKRFLVAADAAYGARLSRVSLHTLVLQGGSLSAAEVAAFEANPRSADALRLRRADEAAKIPGRVVPGIEDWIPILREVAAAFR